MIKPIFLSVLLSSLLIADCGISREFAEFYKLPEGEQFRQFAKFPIDKQIDYHLQAMSVEPSDYKFGAIIGRGGNEIVAPVLRRMKAEKFDHRRVDLMVIFEEYCRNRKCEETNPGLFADLENEISKIQDPFWRQMAEKKLSYMKGEPVPFPTVPRLAPK